MVPDCGMQLASFVEHDSVPWDAFPGYSEEVPGGEHRLKGVPGEWALYAVTADSEID